MQSHRGKGDFETEKNEREDTEGTIGMKGKGQIETPKGKESGRGSSYSMRSH
jgi:hypothetical protein